MAYKTSPEDVKKYDEREREYAKKNRATNLALIDKASLRDSFKGITETQLGNYARIVNLAEDIIDDIDNWTVTNDGKSHVSYDALPNQLAMRNDPSVGSVYDRNRWRDSIRFYFADSFMTAYMTLAPLTGNRQFDINADIEFEGSRQECYGCSNTMSLTVNIPKKTMHFSCAAEKCIDNKYHSVEVNIPSGKIVMGDWPYGLSYTDPSLDRMTQLDVCLRRNGNILDAEHHLEKEGYSYRQTSVNSLMGKKLTSDYHARFDMVHMFVGNTCPDVYLAKNGDILVGRGEMNDDDYEIEDEENIDWDTWEPPANPEFDGGTKLGSICTDLWWTTIMDFDKYNEFLAKYNPGGLIRPKTPNQAHRREEIAEVPPGRYRFTNYYPIDGDDANVFIRGVRIGDCE